MPQDAAASGATTSDADSTAKGDTDSDAGTSGDDSQPDVTKIVAERVAQKLKSYGDLKELKRKADEFDKQQTANQSETERLQARIDELERRDADRETERKQERVQTAAVREAARLGFRDPADAYRLLDTSEITFEDDQPTNLPKLLTALSKEKPYLTGAAVNGSADGGQQGGSSVGTKPSMNDLLRGALGSD